MASDRYTVHTINENTFAIEEKSRLGQGLCYLLCGTDKALLIDTCFGYKGFPEVIKSLTGLPVVVANTHAHLDHIGGNHFFNELWYHQADKDIFSLHTDRHYTLQLLTAGMPRIMRILLGIMAGKTLDIDPSGSYRYFSDGHVFHLGGRDVEVISTPGHTPGSVCFLDRRTRMLFSGDTLCEWGVLLHFPGEGCSPAIFLNSLQKLKQLAGSYDTIWPGHHGFPVEKSYLEDYLCCAEQIVDQTASYSITKGRRCAGYGRVLITVPDEEAVHG